MDINVYCGSKFLSTLSYNYPSNPQPPTQSIDISKLSSVYFSSRCYIQCRGSDFVVVPYANYKNVQKVVVLLESPHKDEFDENFNPLVPLNGAAGKRFDKKIVDKMQSWFKNVSKNQGDVFEIILFNPVPYQTSMHHFLSNKIPYQPLAGLPTIIPNLPLDRKLRDAFWLLLFDKPCCKDYFLQWVQNSSPQYIINCCTGNASKNCSKNLAQNLKLKRRSNSSNLKGRVRSALIEIGYLQGCYYAEDVHPTVW